jgi:subtilisin family serine protease
MSRSVRPLVLLAAIAASCCLAAPAWASPPPTAEVVVMLDAPPLATAIRVSRVLAGNVKKQRLDLDSPTSTGYVAALAASQRVVERRIVAAIPSARIRWRYRIVANGLAVAVPRARIGDLARVSGIAHLYAGGAYAPALDQSPGVIGAPALWGLPSLSTAGNGVKIGIIDMGVDPRLPFFDPAGYAYPAGFPKGNRTWTTPKVIAARAFAPPNVTWKYARTPYDPLQSDHGDHVAGIAAGNYGLHPIPTRGVLSGVAPRAYIGNYKVLSTPSDFGLIENSAEVVAGIEAAVKDGMDVINLSLGEYEINPARNLVDAAIDAAADAGVVPVEAAGNSFREFGRGSIGSPATAAKGIAVAAVSKTGVLASFSSRGPTPISLRFKPDVSAPGVSILSSVPAREGSWSSFSGTSMAAPHVAGAAALLIQRHPDWTVAQLKSALVLTGHPVFVEQGGAEAPATGQGGGLINLPDANDPLIFAAPSSISFGLVRAGKAARATAEISDAGGGAGTWGVSVHFQTAPGGVKIGAPATVSVPGRLELNLTSSVDAKEADLTGFVVLSRGPLSRRIPFWSRIERPRLGAPTGTLVRAGRYKGDTRLGRARVSSYRYPDAPEGVGITNTLPGPEQVFRVRIAKPVANFGIRVVQTARGVHVSPRIVAAGDENRLAGVPALPMDLNPYRDSYGQLRPISGAILPSPGAYDVVFDTRSRSRAGPYAFRLWIDDTTPPRARLLTHVSARGGALVVSVADGGSGVDPRSIRASIDGQRVSVKVSASKATVALGGRFARGRHKLVFQVSDFQETKNSENTPGFLGNTTVLRASFRVR